MLKLASESTKGAFSFVFYETQESMFRIVFYIKTITYLSS